MFKIKATAINPYETLDDAMHRLSFVEDILSYTIESSTNEANEMIYQLDIHFREEEGAVRIEIPVLTAHQLNGREMLRHVMHTLGWRKERD